MECKDSNTAGMYKMVKIQSKSVCPSARSGHRSVADENNLWIIGGFNPEKQGQNHSNTTFPLFRELWRFNFASSTWNLIKCHGEMPTELASHSGLIDGSYMLVFGGTGFPFGEDSSNKLSVCHLDTGVWTEFGCTGEVPEEKYGQAMISDGRNVYIHGGTTGCEYNSNLHKLDLSSRQWEKIIPNSTTNDVPEERYRHEIALFDNRLYVLGGGTSNSVFSLETIHTFDMSANNWATKNSIPDLSSEQGFPMARRCHGCVQLKDEAFVSGGYDGYNILGDVWKLNLRSLRWTKLLDMAEPVYFHSVAVTQAGCMFIFGGVSCIQPTKRTDSFYKMWLKLPNLQTLCWQKLLNSYPKILHTPHQELLQLGISREYVNKLPCSGA